MVVAGGQSSRMGREKALLEVNGQTIIARIIAIVAPQVSRLVINANGDRSRFAALDVSVLEDLHRLQTPLAGLHTALSLAKAEGFEAALTIPSDTPFLPADVVSRLLATDKDAAIAASGGQQHYLTGLWSVGLLPRLEAALSQPKLPRLQDWTRGCAAAAVEWPVQPYDPFFNVNGPEELAEARRIAAEFGL